MKYGVIIVRDKSFVGLYTSDDIRNVKKEDILEVSLGMFNKHFHSLTKDEIGFLLDLFQIHGERVNILGVNFNPLRDSVFSFARKYDL